MPLSEHAYSGESCFFSGAPAAAGTTVLGADTTLVRVHLIEFLRHVGPGRDLGRSCGSRRLRGRLRGEPGRRLCARRTLGRRQHGQRTLAKRTLAAACRDLHAEVVAPAVAATGHLGLLFSPAAPAPQRRVRASGRRMASRDRESIHCRCRYRSSPGSDVGRCVPITFYPCRRKIADARLVARPACTIAAAVRDARGPGVR